MPLCLMFLAFVGLYPQASFAWGATGHRIISSVGIKSLPDDIPAFLRSDDSASLIGELGREPDRSKGSGHSHDKDLDPGHYLNLGDNGLIGDAVPIDSLPDSREAYDTALREKGLDEYKVGFLPYSIIDGWQQLTKDFAYWRADDAGIRFSSNATDKGWYERDKRLHEMLILRDAGYWSHFVGDGSQPLHVTTHFNGWGNFDNPEKFSNSNTVHADFEGKYVSRYIKTAMVSQSLPKPVNLGCDIQKQTASYLIETNKQVAPFYRLMNTNTLSSESDEISKFAISRLASGAAELRDLIVAAWKCSLDASVGYPPVPVTDIESGQKNPIRELDGLD